MVTLISSRRAHLWQWHVFAFSIAAVLNIYLAFLAFPGTSCHAIEEVENIVDHVYKLAYDNEVPGLTDDQWEKIEFLYSAYTSAKKSAEDKLHAVNAKIYSVVQEPLPPKESLIALQQEVNGIQASLDDSAMQTAFAIRKVLSPEQLKSLYLVNPDSEFHRAKLTSEQIERMQNIARESKIEGDKLKKNLAEQQFELSLLLQHPTIDEKELFVKQSQINELNSQIADRDLKLKLKLRDVLDWQQKNKLYNSHRSNMFSALAVTKEQDGRIMELHCKRENATNAARRQMVALASELMAKFQQPESTEQSMAELQKQIDQAAAQARIQETEVVADIRIILNAQQRARLSEMLKLESAGKIAAPPYPETDECHHHSMH